MTKRNSQNLHKREVYSWGKFVITLGIQKHDQNQKIRNKNVFKEIDNRCIYD